MNRDILRFVKRDKLDLFVNESYISEVRESFASAEPFDNVVLDDLFDDRLLDELISNFPNCDEKKWWVYGNPLEKKLALNDLSQLDPIFLTFFDFVNSLTFVSFLQKLTGVEDLIPDSNLNGGGLHQIMPGGKLDIHEDYNIHRELRALRKVNAILYLNENWRDEWGGHLELWDKDMTRCVKKISPIRNRLVVFRTDQTSNHGHPHPLTCPEGVSRKSLASYYYAKVQNIDSIPYRSTFFKRLPGTEEDPSLDELRKKRVAGRVEDKTT